MDLGAVITETETALDTIPGLRAYGWAAPSINPPAAIVSLPETLLFHQTYGAGSTKIDDLIILVMVGRADQRLAVKNLMPYCKETGATSVKATLEGYAWTTLDVFTVLSVDFDAVEYKGNPYLAAMFHTEIVGRGA